MTSKRMYVSALVLITAVSFSGCTLKQMIKLAKQQQLQTQPSPLELHGDSVAFNVSAKLPVKMLKKKTNYSLELSYRPVNKEAFAVGAVGFKAEDFPKAKTQEPKLDRRFAFAYKDEYKQGDLLLKGVASKGAKSKETPVLDLAKGVITTSRLALPSYSAVYLPHGYVPREEYIPTYVDFYFEQGKSDLRKTERAGNDAKNMEAYIAAKNATRTVNITGMHSPEGPEAINSTLSSERAQVVQKFFQDMMAKYDYKDDAKNINFVLKPVVQDWNAFRAVMQVSPKLNDKQKAEIAAIVEGPGEFVSKELKLQALPYYNVLLRDVYPPLRTAKIEILQIKPKPTEAEIVVLAKQIAEGRESADKLSAEEMLFAADKTPDLGEKERIYQAVIKKSDSHIAYNNLGVVYLNQALNAEKAGDKAAMMAAIDKAVVQLEYAAKKKETPESHINLAGVKLMKGDLAAAKASLEKASGAGGSVGTAVNAMRGYLAIAAADYPSAIQYLSGGGDNPTVLYNKGLAYLLNASKNKVEADFAKSAASLKEAVAANDKNGLSYYVAAIVAARTKNEAAMTDNLKAAISRDASLKERAVRDLEFVGYWESASFKEALR